MHRLTAVILILLAGIASGQVGPAPGVTGGASVGSGSMTWPASAGLAFYNGSSAWGASLPGGGYANSNGIFLGSGALTAFTDANATDGDIAIGQNALHLLATVHDTTGGEIGIGYGALASANSGVVNSEGNTCVGYLCLHSITTQVYNTAFGYQALQNATVSENTAVGYQAMGTGVVTGSDNVAVGALALKAVTSGTENIAIGDYAGFATTTPTCNIAIGYDAERSLTVSNFNIAIGASALFSMTNDLFAGNSVPNCTGNTGGFNIAMGSGAGYAITTGYANTAIGHTALLADTTGHGNMAIGYFAMGVMDTGHDNTAVGAEASEQLTGNAGVTDNSVSLGTDAYYGNIVTPTPFAATSFTALGAYAGQNVATGADDNVFVGYGSGGNVTTGHDNIVIGSNVAPTSATAANELDIGNAFYCTGIFSSNTWSGVSGATVTTGPTAGVKCGVGTEAPIVPMHVVGLSKSTSNIQQVITSNFTTSATTLATAGVITGLNFTVPASVASNWSFTCNIVYSQATGAAANIWGITTAGTAPTSLLAFGEVLTSQTGTQVDNNAIITTATSTTVITATPGAFGAIGTAADMFQAHLWGTVEAPSNASPTQVGIAVASGSASDALTIYRGSFCKWE